MAKLTVAQLTQQLEAAHVSYQVLEQSNHNLAERLAESNAACAKANMQLAALQPRAPREVVKAHANYREALSAARELAIRTGKCVDVVR